MVSLGPEDYGMPNDKPFPWRTFLVCIAVVVAIVGYGLIDMWIHPDETAAAFQRRYDECTPAARYFDRFGRPNCDLPRDMKAKGKDWPPG